MHGILKKMSKIKDATWRWLLTCNGSRSKEDVCSWLIPTFVIWFMTILYLNRCFKKYCEGHNKLNFSYVPCEKSNDDKFLYFNLRLVFVYDVWPKKSKTFFLSFFGQSRNYTDKDEHDGTWEKTWKSFIHTYELLYPVLTCGLSRYEMRNT